MGAVQIARRPPSGEDPAPLVMSRSGGDPRLSVLDFCSLCYCYYNNCFCCYDDDVDDFCY